MVFRARELEKRVKVTTICGFQRGDISDATFPHFLQIVPACPINRPSSIDTRQHYIRHNARMPAVPVWKRMNLDEPMMQPDRRL